MSQVPATYDVRATSYVATTTLYKSASLYDVFALREKYDAAQAAGGET